MRQTGLSLTNKISTFVNSLFFKGSKNKNKFLFVINNYLKINYLIKINQIYINNFSINK